MCIGCFPERKGDFDPVSFLASTSDHIQEGEEIADPDPKGGFSSHAHPLSLEDYKVIGDAIHNEVLRIIRGD